MKAGQVKKQYTVDERLLHVAAYKASGKSLLEYSRTVGVNDQTLYNWVKGRNLKTQAKKVEAKKVEAKKSDVDKAPKFGTLPPMSSPTVIQVPCPTCARFEKKAYVVTSLLLNFGILAALVKVVLAH